MKKKSTTGLRKSDAPVAVAFVAIGVLLAYLVTSFTYGQDPEDGVIDFSRPTRTAPANVSDAFGTKDNFGTKAAGLFSLFDSTPTAFRTATATLTPSSTPVPTEEKIKHKPDATATATRRPADTKTPVVPTSTKKPRPTSTGTKVPTTAPTEPPSPTEPPPASETPGTPMPPPGGALISGSFSLQGSYANLSGPAFTGGVTDPSRGACGSFLCRLIALIFKTPGGW